VTLAEAGTTCCYARSDKYWAEDPQGVRWESFHTHGEATTYYVDPVGIAVARDSCCGPIAAARDDKASGSSACGVPADQQVATTAAACCG